ncbi:thiosulfate/3-mercaptopyruvate sulfurtransferase 2 isoform X3 [Arabidopsis lyrata subsp. lyrata]|uniref:thiosulfate/3-mercaptopyruvate sulfurtransferase 2 isoform X3 n=1 Tax=Arabidopsis lyrata subsp. lyrata TaxID=81972 RepID=UPI000A29E539|nr:thiosulfate/3-mercaptopyruvate sulfurtransferase 2 isoform X3 [Arabidopsis lyrata subsp. lyrata]|eukprot:XP_020868961.1 thiosulfate/3-mercaptopyruvate sulfurtransferase 2 isoform X3 [Arabidopsis lyrata subsp. lyrata]
MPHGTCHMSKEIQSKSTMLLISQVLSSLIWMEYLIKKQIYYTCYHPRKLLLLVVLLLESRTKMEWLCMMEWGSLVQLVYGGEMFRIFGHDKVWVLDGGLPKWRASGYDVESIASSDAILKASAATEAIEKINQGQTISPITFQTKFRSHLVLALDQVKKNIEDKTYQHIDARSKARFDGIAPEPWKGITSGHIPGSKCVPFSQMFDSSQTLLPAEELKKRFEQEDISLDSPIVASCGTGVTACILALGLYRLGKTDVAIYDGSWTEWATVPNLPIVGSSS